jgi:DNA-binding transcriptional MocR family regulator
MPELTQYRIRASSAADLVRGIEAAVAAGTLAPGAALPSVRRLAAEVGLSPATVAAALAELRRRGVVLTERRRGSRICDGPPIGMGQAPLAVPPGVRDLSRGNPDPELLPDLGAALRGLEAPARLYGEAPAIPALLAVARAQLRQDGVPAEALCVVSGALDGIERVLQAHMRAGDRVAVENPGYAELFHTLRARGLQLEPVPVDDRGMLPRALAGALAAGAGAVVLTPRGQNPTGAALDAVRAGELRAVLDRWPRALLLEDDHLGQVAGVPLLTLAAGRERWAATRSVAKALGPDLRVAVLAGDADTVARVQGAQQRGPGWVSFILQSLVLALWSDPAVGRLTARAARTYARRRERLLDALARRGVVAHGASGLNVWVPVAEEAAVVATLLQRGWALAPGSPYRLAGSAPAVRVTTATLRAEEAEVLAGDIAAVLAPTAWARSG